MTHSVKEQIVNMVLPDLEKVEAALETHLEPNLELVKEIASHLLFSGGKRLRPLLMIHSARLCGYQNGFEIDFSTIFEYLHAATLLPDDERSVQPGLPIFSIESLEKPFEGVRQRHAQLRFNGADSFVRRWRIQVFQRLL